MQPLTLDLLIDNRAVATAKRAEVRDPGNLETVLGRVAQAGPEEVDQAVRAALAAFPDWRDRPLAKRAALLEEIAKCMEANKERLTKIVSAETGMMPIEIGLEIVGAIYITRDTIEIAEGFLKPDTFEDDKSWVSVEKVPVGVIANFVPWNAPIVLMMRKLAPALITGNTVVVKSPSPSPLGVGVLLGELARLLPPGVLNLVHGGPPAGQALAAHPGVGKIGLTGGGVAARAIMKTAAEGLKGVQFELGGNDPAIVLDDADLERTVPDLVAGTFHRAGQFCFAIKRIYVPRAMYDRFYARMGQELSKFRVGHPHDPRTTMGPMNNAAQYDYVKGLAERARAAGYRVDVFGQKVDPATWDKGYYMLPMLVRHPDAKAEIVACEQFGPIVPVLAYDSEDEVVAAANDSPYGLGSSIWTTNGERAIALARRLEAGMTYINRNVQSRLGRRHMPFGGVKESGIGTENTEAGMAEYIEYHAINLHK